MSDQEKNTIADRFEAYLLGQLDDAAMDQLEEELRQDPQQADDCIDVMATLAMVREQFRDQREQAGELTKDPTLHGFHDLLAELSAMEASAEAEQVHWVGQVKTARPIWQQWQFMIPSGIAALLAIAVVLIVALPNNNRTTTSPPITNNNPSEPGRVGPADASALTKHVATLTAEHDAVWDRRPGEKLYAGNRFTLTRGFAEITTSRGAVAILQAPCTVEMTRGENELYLLNGKLVGLCYTPTSKGFVVRTNQANITDIGTEFGVEVGPEYVKLSVLTGSAAIQPLDRAAATFEPEIVIAGQARSVVSGVDGLVPSRVDPSAFYRAIPSDYEQTVRGLKPVVYCRFEEDNKQLLLANTGSAAGEPQRIGFVEPDPNGAVGSAANFKGTGQIFFETEATHELKHTFTVAAWVRTEEKGAGVQRVVSNAHYLNRAHAGFALGIKRDVAVNRTLPYFTFFGFADYQGTTPIPVGEWVHLAVTVDKNGTPLLYINGQAVKTIMDPQQRPVPGGLIRASNKPLLIGTSRLKNGKQGESFEGGIDELAIFDSVLTPNQILSLSQALPEQP